MADERCTDGFLPWLLAWEWNFLPDEEGKHELDDIGGNRMMIFLASHNINSKCLIIYDQEWNR